MQYTFFDNDGLKMKEKNVNWNKNHVSCRSILNWISHVKWNFYCCRPSVVGFKFKWNTGFAMTANAAPTQEFPSWLNSTGNLYFSWTYNSYIQSKI